MKRLKKITGFSILTAIFLLTLSPTAFAQSALDDIKSTLEGEGIAVIDYSTPEDAWGSLPTEWTKQLSGNFDGINDIAGRFESEFIGSDGLTDKRREKAILEAQKSRMTNAEAITQADEDITELEEDINELEESVKDSIISDILGDLSESDLNADEGAELIFNEVDFYYNYSKWGRLPLRIVGMIESETDYRSLEDILNISGIAGEEDEEIRTEIIEDLIDEFDSYEGFSRDDAELVVGSLVILQASGESQINQIGRSVVNAIKNLAGALAVLWIIIAGVRMIFAQGDENTITEQKKAILYGVIGLAAILLMDRMIDIIYGVPGDIRTELVRDTGFSTEVYGIIQFLRTIIGTVAIFFIILSGLKMMFAQGEEDAISKQRKALLYVALGIVIIAVNEVLVKNIFIMPVEQSDQISSSNVTNIINTIGTVTQFLLGFVGLITFGILVYGGATMIMNYGNDEMVEKSKKIIKNAVIGILVILSAYAIVATLVVFR
jgi:hypothetical protein